ncbi:MAG: acyltransferase [Coriobacteriia bacterium]|nr:acyltransferase [Coriobacteriia bacterium]
MSSQHEIDELLRVLRQQMRERYHRMVPTGELLFDRFSKAAELGAGTASSVYDSSLVLGEVEIGENVWVGPNTILDGYHAKLSIGNWVTIAAGVCIYTHDSSKRYLSGGRDTGTTGAVTIGDCSVIGTLAVINPGVTIGKHCLIGSHALVNKDIPDNSIALGVPAKVVGRVNVSTNGSVKYDWD